MLNLILNRHTFFLAFFILLVVSVNTATAQSTGFTYQGRLSDNNSSANGNYDFEFKLFDALTGGTQDGTPRQVLNVAVTNGTFTVLIDFGAGAFPGADRFLEISVRLAGGTSFTTLTPRQQITMTPYAIKSSSADQAAFAINATNAINATTAQNALQLGGVAANQYVQTNDSRLSDDRNPLPNSSNYVQNRMTQQTTSNFNISGNGTVGGTLSSSIVNANTQYNIGNQRILSNAGSNNLFAGVNAGAVNTGSGNSFFGVSAGSNNSTGSSNSFFGNFAGLSNATGIGNSFFGIEAGRLNTAGNNNSFFGISSGRENTGGNNSFFGRQSGRFNTTGVSNSYFGESAGLNNTTGNFNTFFGKSAGDANTTGSNNTLIGFSANVGADNLTNASAIGSRAFVELTNSLVLGSVNGKNGATSDVNVGIGTTAPDAPLDIESQLVGAINLRVTNYGGRAAVRSRSAGGTRTAPTATQLNDILFELQADGYTGSAFTAQGRAKILIRSTQDWTSAANGTAIDFFTTPNNTTLPLQRMVITNDGKVGIGRSNVDAELDVNGDIRVGLTGGTTGCIEDRDGTIITGTCSSDLRFKKNITPFGNILNSFSKLRPVNYFWRKDEFAEKHFGDKQSFGLIAQEVEQIFPDLVLTDEQGYKAVNYSKLPLLTIQAVNELKAENDTLRLQVEEQKKQMQQQQSLIEGLRKLICQNNLQAEVCK
jgi:hypothetical protein